MQKLNILYLLADHGHDLTLNQGFQVHVWQILKNLEKLGHAPFLLTINEKKVLPDFARYETVAHLYFPLVHRLMPYTGMLDSLRVARAIRRRHATAKFDLIHERYGLYSFGGALAAKWLGIPYLLEVNAPAIEEKVLFGPPLTGAQRGVARSITRINLKHCDAIITVSRFLKGKIVQAWNVRSEKVLVLTNAADSALFRLNGRHENHDSDGKSKKLVIGYLGTLQPWFGIENLLYAFQIVSRHLPRARLQIIGDGMQRPALEALAKRLKIKSKTTFVGSIPHTSVGRYLQGFDIAVAPYRPIITGFYGSSMKVFEYMAAGKAIVASHIGQLSEVLENRKTAMLVEPGETEELAQAILRLAKNPRLRENLAVAARNIARQNYSWDQYAQKLEDIYKRILSTRNGSAGK
ncbi:MAG: glycosyltransferase family 4 protein [bacterium]